MVVGIGLTMVAVMCVLLRKHEREKREERDKSVCGMKNGKQDFGTKDLFLRTLTEMKCQYEIDEDHDEQIVFDYQGEKFQAFASNNRPYVWIRVPFFMSIDQGDIEEMARMRRVINDANLNTVVTTVYTLLDDDKTFNVHLNSNFLFLSQIPDLVGLLRVELNAFFKAKHFIQIELEKLRQKEGVE